MNFRRTIAGLVILLAVGYWPVACRQATTPDQLAQDWLVAVANQDAKAVEIASQLAEDATFPEPSELELKIVGASKLSVNFLTSEFSKFDLQAWHQAAFFHDQAQKIVANKQPGESEIAALFRVVTDRLADTDPETIEARWPYKIWELEGGLCDRQSWVLCELAYQLGYDAKIVYLGQDRDQPSPHTICEIRDAAGKVWTADPLSDKLLPDVPVVAIARQPELAKATWPDRLDWQEAITTSVFFSPSMPQDYCPRNQWLYTTLKSHLGKACPRFGEPPRSRIERFRSVTPEDDLALKMGFWEYPLKVLAWEIEHRRP